MKTSLKKRLGTVTLVLVMLLGFIPIAPKASASCEYTLHTPDLTTLYPADWNAQTGGYGYDYNKCKLCGWGCDENGRSHVFVDASNGCSGGYKCHVPGNPYTTACSGTFKDTLYYCSGCNEVIDSDGTLADMTVLDGHTPDTTTSFPADYTQCNGGYKTAYYTCTVCNEPTDANGNGVVWSAPTGHDPDLTTLYPADWNAQTGGYGYDYYKCKLCGWGCDENGRSHVFVDASNGCSGGYKCHLPGSEEQPADYTPCFGGFKTPYYLCTNCNTPVDANGTVVLRDAGGQHTPGSELQPANYTSCNGGFTSDFYICTVCDCPVNADGSDAEFTDGTGVHTPGSELQPANYSPCNGGFKTDFYICIFCECPLDENGEEPVWYDGNGEHTLVQVPEKAPTYEEYGYVSFWQCKYCGTAYKDAEGTAEIVDVEEILLPKLEKPADENQRVNVTTGIEEVPQSIADKYTSVDDVQKELVKAAVTAESKLDGDNTKSVLLDVELQIQNSDGTWEAVTPENFPEEGVEVLLPYPEGTNKDDYTFVVTHMITSGSRAGEVEVLNGTLEDDGIRVKFTSMSPVVIAYQEITAEEPAEDKPTEDKPTEDKPTEDEPTDKNSPQTGDSSYLVLWTVMLLSSGLCLVCLTRKKKAK